MTKSKGNGTVAGAVVAEAADTANGAANVAANLAAENSQPVNQPESQPEASKTRGRKAANGLTFAKFAAEIRNGGIPDGVEYVAPKQEGNRIVEWGYFRAIEPVIALNENGDLTLTELYTAGRSNKPMSKPISTIPHAEVLAWLNSRKNA